MTLHQLAPSRPPSIDDQSETHPAPEAHQAITADVLDRRIAALPSRIQAYVKLAWERAAAPRDQPRLEELVAEACAAIGACPSDFPALSAAERRALTASLNDLARSGASEARSSIVFSPAVRQWIVNTAPSSALPDARHRADSVRRALAVCSSFLNVEERRSGDFYALGTAFRFHIHYCRPCGSHDSPVPWNADLTRRQVVVSREGERLNLQPSHQPKNRTGA